IDQVVRGYATTTTVLSSVNPSRVGQPVVFSATVGSDGGGTPTGTVQFAVDGADVGEPVILASGVASTDPVSSLAVGIHSVTAVYQGTPSYTTSADALHGVIVGRADTTTSVGSSPNPSTFGQAVTFTATVVAAPPGAGTPTGTVSFFVDGGLLQTLPLGGESTAATSIATLAGGTHTVTATYAGNASFNPGTSAPVTQTVSPAATTTTGVTATVNPSV